MGGVVCNRGRINFKYSGDIYRIGRLDLLSASMLEDQSSRLHCLKIYHLARCGTLWRAKLYSRGISIMSNITQTAKKSMLLVGTLLLASCAAPTLYFPIPKDKIAAFNECMVPAQLGQEKDKNDWLNGLRKFVPTDFPEPALLNSLSESISEILNMLYADKQKLFVPEGKELLSVPFDMHMQPFPFFDSRMVDVVEKISDSGNISLLLQPENLAPANSKKIDTTIPGPDRIAIALKAYLLAYFTVSQNTKGETGFISRDGTKFQFPVEINSISGNKIQVISSVDHSQIGADIIRIILEAIRDGSLDECEALPAVSAATGVEADLLHEIKDIKKNNKECESIRKWKIPTEEELSNMQARANAAESMIATAAGKAVRGGSMGSLNNEALARAAETAIGVMARHTTERVEWCRASVE